MLQAAAFLHPELDEAADPVAAEIHMEIGTGERRFRIPPHMVGNGGGQHIQASGQQRPPAVGRLIGNLSGQDIVDAGIARRRFLVQLPGPFHHCVSVFDQHMRFVLFSVGASIIYKGRDKMQTETDGIHLTFCIFSAYSCTSLCSCPFLTIYTDEKLQIRRFSEADYEGIPGVG